MPRTMSTWVITLNQVLPTQLSQCILRMWAFSISVNFQSWFSVNDLPVVCGLISQSCQLHCKLVLDTHWQAQYHPLSCNCDNICLLLQRRERHAFTLLLLPHFHNNMGKSLIEVFFYQWIIHQACGVVISIFCASLLPLWDCCGTWASQSPATITAMAHQNWSTPSDFAALLLINSIHHLGSAASFPNNLR